MNFLKAAKKKSSLTAQLQKLFNFYNARNTLKCYLTHARLTSHHSGTLGRATMSLSPRFNPHRFSNSQLVRRDKLAISSKLHRISGRVSSEDEKRVCSRETRFQRKHIFMNFSWLMREWAKWVSKPVNGVSEQSKRSKAERCWASERSGANKRT